MIASLVGLLLIALAAAQNCDDSKLTYVDMHVCTLSGLGLTHLNLSAPRTVNRLILSANQFSVIPRNAFAHLNVPGAVLEVLLNDCKISRIETHAFKEIDHLLVLNLSHNALENITSGSLPTSLRTLDLSHNRISRIVENTFKDMIDLKTLILRNNNLVRIYPAVFPEVPLSILDLSHNSLEQLRLDVLVPTTYWSGVADLRLAGNPWVCDCNMEGFISLVKRRNFSTVPACQAPSSLSNVPFTRVVLKELICAPDENPYMQEVKARLGQPVTLMCVLYLNQHQKVQWLREDTDINVAENSSRFKIETANGPTLFSKHSALTITDFRESDAGTYHCKVDSDVTPRKTFVVIFENGLSAGVIGGIIVGIVLFLIAVLLLLLLLPRCCRRTSKYSDSDDHSEKAKQELFNNNPSPMFKKHAPIVTLDPETLDDKPLDPDNDEPFMRSPPSPLPPPKPQRAYLVQEDTSSTATESESEFQDVTFDNLEKPPRLSSSHYELPSPSYIPSPTRPWSHSYDDVFFQNGGSRLRPTTYETDI